MGFSLCKKGTTFHLRVYVPLALQKMLGRKELKRSLKTQNKGDARALASSLIHNTNTAFMRLQTGMLTPSQLAQISATLIANFSRTTDEHREELKDSMDFFWNDGRGAPDGLFPNHGDMDLIDVAYKQRKTPEEVAESVAGYQMRVQKLETELSTLDFSDNTHMLAERVVKQHNLPAKMPSPHWFDPNDDERFKPLPTDFLKVCKAVVTGLIDSFNLEITRLQGRSDYALEAAIQRKREAAIPETTFSQLWEIYRDEKVTRGQWGGAGRTESGYASKYTEALGVLGDMSLNHYDDIAVIKFIKSLQKSGNTDSTINSKIEFLSSLFKQGLKKKLCTNNPFAEKQVADDVSAEDKSKRPYTTEDLHGILSGLLSTRKLVEPHRFWVPLIALYTGMRQSEICQLRSEDLVKEDGIFCLKLQHKPALKQFIKKRNVRTVPIHPMLITLGLLKYHGSHKQKGSDRLFPTLSYSKGKGWTGRIRTWYNETFQDSCITDSDKKSFHSFRGTLANQFKQARLYVKPTDRDVIRSIIGHDGGDDVTAKHYEDNFSIAEKHRMLKKLNYRIDPDLIRALADKEV